MSPRGTRAGSEALSEVGPIVARVVAVSVIVLAVLAIAIVATKPRGSYEVEAIFDSTRGVIEGGNVTAGFQKVGTVSEIRLGEDDGLPHVKMKIDGDFVLHQGAFADIRLASNVGAVNRVIDLKQGDPGAPRLEGGDVLGPSHTDEPVDLDRAVSTLDPKTRADAGRLLAGLDEATRGRGPDINRALRHSSAALNETANALGQVASDGVALRSVVANTNGVLAALAQDPQSLAATADRTAKLLDIAAGRQAELRRTVAAIGPGLRSGREVLEALDASVPKLRGLVHEAGPLVDALAPVAISLPDTLRPLRPTVREVRRLVEAGPGYARATQPAIESAIPLVAALDPTLKELNPFLDYLRVRAPDAVSFFALTGDALADYDVNGHLIRFIPRMIQTPVYTNTLGPSDQGAGILERPFFRTPGSLEGDPWEDYASSFVGGGRPVTDYPVVPAP